MKPMEKKSQVFLFDLILSFTFLIISISFLFLYYSNTITTDVYDTNLNFIQGVSKTKINSLNNQEIRDFFIRGDIRNIENTIAQQISEFYYRGELALAINLTELMVQNYFPSQVSLNISLINSSGGVISLYVRNTVSKEESKAVSAFQRDIFGFFEERPYGPYTLISEVWV